MDRPRIPDAPGLAWRARRNGWAAVWVARADMVKKGFRPSTHQILVLTDPSTEEQETTIRKECVRLQEEMYGKAPPTFEPTLHGLIIAYQTDPDSSFKKLSYDERRDVVNHLKHLDREDGSLQLAKLTARDFKRMYETTRWPDGNQEERGKVSYAYARMGNVRRIFSFGLIFEIDPNCKRLREILSEMEFEQAKPRTESMTLRQCEDIIAQALARGLFSVALTQAVQFDFRFRQRDVIGIWEPETEPGISTIAHHHRRKWLRGIRHEEISAGLVLQHTVSKTRKRSGEPQIRDLNLYPMVLELYQQISPEQRTGPLIISEATGRPWKANHFRNKWRECARAAGVPKEVWNMDSRAGGITETIEATGGNLEAARKEAGHTTQKMTVRYSRRKDETTRNTAAAVLEFRQKNKA